MDLPFALVFLRDADGHLRRRAAVGIDGAHPLASPEVGATWPFERALAGETVAVGDIGAAPGIAGGPWGGPC
ncbi:hypothetical protein FHR71_003998 [Methylobacterium sp. RAS18]|nr:hypothetical protein [Methylobacterium sp. RAS18]